MKIWTQDTGKKRFSPTFRPSIVLGLFLLLTFATGGSSWPHEWQLIILRPVAILIAAWGLSAMNAAHWRENRLVWLIFGATFCLTAFHLIPLPYSWWSALPGRAIIAQIDQVAGFGRIARPLSMQPDASLNALISLVVPFAVLSVAVQLDDVDHRRIAGLVLFLIAASALIGTMQLSGFPISLFEESSEINPAGVFNNRNHQSALLAIAFPISILVWQEGGFRSGLSRRSEQVLLAAFCVAIVPLIVVTGSRAGLLLGIAGISAAAAEFPINRVKMPISRTFSIVAKSAGVAALVSLLVWSTVYADRSVAFDRFTAIDQDLRLPLSESVFEATKLYWPIGSGVGTYADVYQISEPDELLRPTYSNHAHNDWLETAFTTGMPGVLIMIAAACACILGAIKAWRIESEFSALPKAGSLVILLIALASVGDYPLRTPLMSGLLALAAVWLSRIANVPSVSTEIRGFS